MYNIQASPIVLQMSEVNRSIAKRFLLFAATNLTAVALCLCLQRKPKKFR